MSIDARIATRIGRPIDDVFAVVVAVERWPDWLVVSGIRRVTRQDDTSSPLRVGDRLTVDQQAAGRASVVAARVTVLEPSTRFALTGRDADGVSIAITADLAAVGPDATDLEWTIRIDLPLRYRMFGSLAAPQVRRATGLDVDGLRRRLESGGED